MGNLLQSVASSCLGKMRAGGMRPDIWTAMTTPVAVVLSLTRNQ